jgi:hypothetical protein
MPGRHGFASAPLGGWDAEDQGGGADQLRGLAVVEVQEASQAFTTDQLRIVVGRRRGSLRRRDQVVVETLMVALEMVASADR